MTAHRSGSENRRKPSKSPFAIGALSPNLPFWHPTAILTVRISSSTAVQKPLLVSRRLAQWEWHTLPCNEDAFNTHPGKTFFEKNEKNQSLHCRDWPRSEAAAPARISFHRTARNRTSPDASRHGGLIATQTPGGSLDGGLDDRPRYQDNKFARSYHDGAAPGSDCLRHFDE
jgi:hypothetical protein